VEADLRPDVIGQSTLLRSSRRLDWRFLLPDFSLQRVAYIGRPDAALYDALERVAGGVEALDGAPAPGGTGRYDLVVCREPTRDELAAAVALVALGGSDSLYAEIERPLAERLRRWRNPARAELEVVRQRLSAECFWHWPNFEDCEEIVPLADSGALRLMVARRRTYGGRVKAVLARVLVSLRLFGPFASSVSVVARSGGQVEGR
jgi:hypothetical protein